jgi:hypothetical protein
MKMAYPNPTEIGCRRNGQNPRKATFAARRFQNGNPPQMAVAESKFRVENGNDHEWPGPRVHPALAPGTDQICPFFVAVSAMVREGQQHRRYRLDGD